MPVNYQAAPRRNKGFRFEGGKLLLGQEDENFGPQNDPDLDPKKSAIDKAGLVGKQQEKKAEEGWKLENEDGSTTDVGSPNQVSPGDDTPQQGPVNESGQIDLSDPKAAQQALADAGYLSAKGVDGKWGKGSQKALNTYYRDNGIVPPVAQKLDQTFESLGLTPKSYAKGGNLAGKGDKLTIDGKPVNYQTSEVSSGGEVSPALVRFAETDLKGIVDAVGAKDMRVIGGNDLYHLSDKYYDTRFKKYYQNNSRGRGDKIRKLIPDWDGKRELTVEERNKLKKDPSIGWKSKHTDGKSMDFTVTPPGLGWGRPKDKKRGKKDWKSNPEFVQRVEKVQQWMLDNGYEDKGKGKYVNKKTGDVILDEYNFPSPSAGGPHFHTGANDGYHG